MEMRFVEVNKSLLKVYELTFAFAKLSTSSTVTLIETRERNKGLDVGFKCT